MSSSNAKKAVVAPEIFLKVFFKSNPISSSKKYYLQKNLIFLFYVHHHISKTPTSVHLLYTIFYINNIFMS